MLPMLLLQMTETLNFLPLQIKNSFPNFPVTFFSLFFKLSPTALSKAVKLLLTDYLRLFGLSTMPQNLPACSLKYKTLASQVLARNINCLKAQFVSKAWLKVIPFQFPKFLILFTYLKKYSKFYARNKSGMEDWTRSIIMFPFYWHLLWDVLRTFQQYTYISFVFQQALGTYYASGIRVAKMNKKIMMQTWGQVKIPSLPYLFQDINHA